MNVYIVVATKGRPVETHALLTQLTNQQYPVVETIVVGNEQSDIAGLSEHDLVQSNKASLHLAPIGSCTQRNIGLDVIRGVEAQADGKNWVVIFFDDDFRPAPNWVGSCVNAFETNKELVGMTGYVLADGVTKSGYSESEAIDYISGKLAPDNPMPQNLAPLKSLYGCNMAFRGDYAIDARFDEDLPLYGWLEDVDFSNRALDIGQLRCITECRGVHLGASKGRTSGVRFGYSQVANPRFLIKKGTMQLRDGLKLMTKNIFSNIFHTLTLNQSKDYQGRLVGNGKAFKDLLMAKCSPRNILDI